VSFLTSFAEVDRKNVDVEAHEFLTFAASFGYERYRTANARTHPT
jgi:hypothetical protein